MAVIDREDEIGAYNPGGGLASTPRPNDAARIRALIRSRYIGSDRTPSFTAPGAATLAGPKPFQAPPAMPNSGINVPGAVPGLPTVQDSSKVPPPPPTGYLSPDINYGKNFLGTLNDILRGFQSSGAYGPGVNQGILDAVRSLALGDAAASRAHNALVSQSLGVDPATAASYYLRSDLGSQGDVARAVNAASLGELTHQRDFGQQLLELLLGKQGPQNVYNPKNSAEAVTGILNSLAAFAR
jgi:hypothetical protein